MCFKGFWLRGVQNQFETRLGSIKLETKYIYEIRKVTK